MIKERVVQLIVDHREAASGLIDELVGYEYRTKDKHVTTHVEAVMLEVGDVICSDRVLVERKSTYDFVDSIINPTRGMMGQMYDLSRTTNGTCRIRPLMILEGETIYGLRGIHPEALRATLAAITVGFGVPIIPTCCVEETAAQLVTIAYKEQFDEGRKISIPHTKRTTMTMPERQAYVVSAIGGGIGAATAKLLLAHFGSVRAVMNAPIDEIVKIKDIGPATAKNIHDIIRSEYKV